MRLKKLKPLVLIFIFLLTACNGDAAVSTLEPSATLPPPTRVPTLTPTVTSTPKPTDTPVPLAALVNGEPLTLAEFEAELARYQASMEESGTELASDPRQVVLNEMINQLLLSQSARKEGYSLDDAALQARIDSLKEQLGGQQALSDWMSANHYRTVDFRIALRRSVEAAWMRDQIAASVPLMVEQVHARQILLYNSEEADQVYSQLQAGSDFYDLATAYDPLSDGDLGWFPRGFLTQPALEEVAFTLEPGEYSPVIETELGYHILQVIEKDAQHSLTPDALLALQILAVQDWLQQAWSQSDIESLLP